MYFRKYLLTSKYVFLKIKENFLKIYFQKLVLNGFRKLSLICKNINSKIIKRFLKYIFEREEGEIFFIFIE